MPRPKKIKPPQINKKTLLLRLVEAPSVGIRDWLVKEYSFLKRLEKDYPLDFLNIVDFGKKLPSLLVLDSKWGKEELAKKFHAFNYQPVEQKQYNLSPEKFGTDIQVQKKQSLRDLL